MEATSITDAIQVILCLNKCLCPKLGPYSERVHFSGYCPGSPHPQCSQVSTAIPGDALLKPSFFLVFSVASCLQMASLKNSTVESSKPSPPQKKKKSEGAKTSVVLCMFTNVFPTPGNRFQLVFPRLHGLFPIVKNKSGVSWVFDPRAYPLSFDGLWGPWEIPVLLGKWGVESLGVLVLQLHPLSSFFQLSCLPLRHSSRANRCSFFTTSSINTQLFRCGWCFSIALLNNPPQYDSEKEVTSLEQGKQKRCGRKIQRTLNFS